MELLPLLMGGSILSSLFNMGSTMGTNVMNQENVGSMESFQKDMSSSAFQRATQDMQKAGINPIMAFSHPASAPSGGAANFQAPQVGDIVGPAMSTALSKERLNNETDLASQRIAQQAYEIDNLAAQNHQIHASTAESIARANQTIQETQIRVPEKFRSDADAAALNNSAVRRARIASTAAAEVGRGIGEVKKVALPSWAR